MSGTPLDVGDFGNGRDVVKITEAGLNPTASVTGAVLLYVDGGELKIRTAAGEVFTIVQAAAALTAADAATIDGTYGSQEQGVLGNVRTRVGEIEAALVAVGILPAA